MLPMVYYGDYVVFPYMLSVVYYESHVIVTPCFLWFIMRVMLLSLCAFYGLLWGLCSYVSLHSSYGLLWGLCYVSLHAFCGLLWGSCYCPSMLPVVYYESYVIVPPCFPWCIMRVMLLWFPPFFLWFIMGIMLLGFPQDLKKLDAEWTTKECTAWPSPAPHQPLC